MDLRIALAGNPNSGKTTLFNALTGSNQFVGNWPGVTVEKKEGKLKKHDGVIITDLPGIYSLSPYTLEEVVARNYLIDERPDAILNIIDGTNLERNLYLTTQLTELGIPVVIAINMMDVVRKNGDKINVDELSRQLGCKIVEISALKGDGVMDAAEAAIEAAKSTKTVPMHTFEGSVEHAIAHIEEAAVHELPEEQQRWYAIKIFERDDKAAQQLGLAEVPCVVADDLTPSQVKAFRLADNKVSDVAILDNKKLLAELDDLDCLGEDLFTGFELGGLFDNTLDESDKTAIENNDIGVMYEAVFKSDSKEKLDRLQKIWEDMQNEGQDADRGNLGEKTGNEQRSSDGEKQD